MVAHTPVARDIAELSGYFGPASLTWRIGRESVMTLGGGRAVLMQLAHPLVAAGVSQHSGYARDPWGRTAATLELTQRIAFGTRAEANEAARFINHLHRGMVDALERDAGTFARGAPYRARQHDLLPWVHADGGYGPAACCSTLSWWRRSPAPKRNSITRSPNSR